MSGKKTFLVVISVLIMAVCVCAQFRVGVVFATGGLGDRSFNDSGYEGVKRAEKELGIAFDYVEPQAVADFESHQRAFAQSNKYDLIICLGFDQADALKKVAKEYPKQKFVLIDSDVDAPNVAAILSKDHEKSFLVGAFAAMLTKDTKNFKQMNSAGKIGIVGGMPIPLIKAFAAGYTAGAKYIDPKIEVYEAYAGGWSDPAKAKEQALIMYSRGADIVFQAAGGSGLGVFKAAKQAKKYAIGVDSNQNYIEPDHILFSAVRRLDNVLYNQIADAMKGQWKPGIYKLGLKEKAVDYDLTKSNLKIPTAMVEKVEELRGKIIAGEIVVPDKLEDVDAFLKNVKR